MSNCAPVYCPIPGGYAKDWIVECSWIATLIILIVFVIFILIIDIRSHIGWEIHVNNTQSADSNDSLADIMQKLENINNDTSPDIIWRKALVVSLILTFVIELFVLWRVPNLYEYLIGVIIAFVIIYLTMGWRNAHETRFQRSKVRRVIKNLKEKYKLSEKTDVFVV